jgi:hypothetical protein
MTAASDTLGIGVIGVGRIAHAYHLPAWRRRRRGAGRGRRGRPAGAEVASRWLCRLYPDCNDCWTARTSRPSSCSPSTDRTRHPTVARHKHLYPKRWPARRRRSGGSGHRAGVRLVTSFMQLLPGDTPDPACWTAEPSTMCCSPAQRDHNTYERAVERRRNSGHRAHGIGLIEHLARAGCRVQAMMNVCTRPPAQRGTRRAAPSTPWRSELHAG